MSLPHNVMQRFPLDKYLLSAVAILLALGLLMVASSSIVIAGKFHLHVFYYVYKQLIFLGLGIFLIFVLINLPTQWWFKIGPPFLIAVFVLCVIVLVPGIGHTVNGSRRWLNLGLMVVQVSELAKLAVIVYLAGYIVRHNMELREHAIGFVKPMLLLAFLSLLLLCQPDFGATVVILSSALAMLFLAGVRLWQFSVLVGLVLFAMSILAISSPYRLQRLLTFLEPWANQFDSGYQLTQSLIAFGRGGWLGVGLGESVQKLFYLPEAHTDFLYAVLAEELGLFGAFLVVGLFALLVIRGIHAARCAIQREAYFCAFLAYGLSLWLGLQAAVNIGVNMGVLPTKGLTLPLMSYGGSSLLVSCIAVGILLRIGLENRLAGVGSYTPGEQKRYTRYA